jgi:selenocysteine-specific elongation factor
MAPRAVVVGTAGHVDHGKTALVRALTGVETDRLREERERGLTIDLGFAPLDLGPGLEAGLVDVPGHEDFLRNMLAGASGVDVLLLVVAADEGPMPQTREHLAIARLLGVECGVVALSKVDRVEPEWLRLAQEATREELAAAGVGSDWPVVGVSAVTGTGLKELRDALRAAAAGAPPRRRTTDLFRLPVDRAFSVRGVGTVVTGTVWSGRVAAGDDVRLLPSDRTARVRTLQVHGRDRPEAGAGLRCALALAGVGREETGRGETVVTGRGWRPSRRLGARVSVLAGVPRALAHATVLRLHLGTQDLRVRVLLSGRDEVRPGEAAWAVLDAAAPVVARCGDRFVLRSLSPVATTGGGIVAELDPPRRWRGREGAWSSLVGAEPGAAEAAAVELAAGRGLDPVDLPLRSGVWRAPDDEPPAGTERIGDLLFAKEWRVRARRTALDLLAAAHARRPRLGWEPLESLRAHLEREFAPPLYEAALGDLVGEGRLERRGPELRLAGHEARLAADERAACGRVLASLRQGGLAPPGPAALAAACGGDRRLLNDLLRLLVEEGSAVAVAPDLYLEVGRERELRAAARRVLEATSPAAPSDFAAETGLSRRQLIPLLEHLDRIGWTRRTGEGRVPGPAATDARDSGSGDADQSR